MGKGQGSMSQPPLFKDPIPPGLDGIDLRLGDCYNVLRTLEHGSVGLVHADPAWVYRNDTGKHGKARDHYECLRLPDITEHLDMAYDVAVDDCYLLCWATYPTQREWFEEEIAAHLEGAFRWEYVSGGAWVKQMEEHNGAVRELEPGIGFHWRGDAEALMLYRKGKPKPRRMVRNGRVQPPTLRHSEKPAEWLAELVAAFSDPGDIVLDLYAGHAPLALPAVQQGRRYLGIEIDAKRHAAALGLIAQGGL